MHFNIFGEALPAVIFFFEEAGRELFQIMLVLSWMHHEACTIVGLQQTISLE